LQDMYNINIVRSC